LLASRQIMTAITIILCLGLGHVQYGQIMSLLFQQPEWTGAGFGLSATTAGWLLIGPSFLPILSSPISAKITSAYGARRTAAVGGMILVPAWIAVATEYHGLALICALGSVALIGYSLLLPALFSIVLEKTPRENTGEITGVAFVGLHLGLAIGSQVLGVLFAGHVVTQAGRAGAFPSDAAYALSFWYITAVTLIAIALLAAIPRARSRNQASNVQPAFAADA